MCIADKLSGFTMPLFKIVMERGAHGFKVHERAELPGVSAAELEELVSTASASKGDDVICLSPFCARVTMSLLLLTCLRHFSIFFWL